MTYKVKDGPRPEEHPVRNYRVLSSRCVWGAQGEIIERALAPRTEAALLKAGVLELAPETPEFVAPDEPDDRPLKSADQEG